MSDNGCKNETRSNGSFWSSSLQTVLELKSLKRGKLTEYKLKTIISIFSILKSNFHKENFKMFGKMETRLFSSFFSSTSL